jgi:acyl-CoA reductase-like NAD-dependent aldehyde dehydrogenase
VRERRIRSLAEAIEFLRAAQAANEPAVLWAASDAEGGLWLTALLDQARAAVPGAAATAALACGDRAGDAMAALRAGIRRIGFTGSAAVAAKLAALGAELAELPPDPGVPGATDRRGG